MQSYDQTMLFGSLLLADFTVAKDDPQEANDFSKSNDVEMDFGANDDKRLRDGALRKRTKVILFLLVGVILGYLLNSRSSKLWRYLKIELGL